MKMINDNPIFLQFLDGDVTIEHAAREISDEKVTYEEVLDFLKQFKTDDIIGTLIEGANK